MTCCNTPQYKHHCHNVNYFIEYLTKFLLHNNRQSWNKVLQVGKYNWDIFMVTIESYQQYWRALYSIYKQTSFRRIINCELHNEMIEVASTWRTNIVPSERWGGSREESGQLCVCCDNTAPPPGQSESGERRQWNNFQWNIYRQTVRIHTHISSLISCGHPSYHLWTRYVEWGQHTFIISVIQTHTTTPTTIQTPTHTTC